MTIGNRVEVARIKQNLTQALLADRVGVAQPTISDIERGKAPVHSDLLLSLSKELHVSADWLLDGTITNYVDTRFKNLALKASLFPPYWQHSLLSFFRVVEHLVEQDAQNPAPKPES